MSNLNSLQFIIFISNILTAFSFFLLAYNFFVSCWKLKVAHYLFKSEDELSKKLILMLTVVQLSFALFITLCGLTHVINAIEYVVINPSSYTKLKCSILIICSIASFFTAIFTLSIFPFVRAVMRKYELSNEGTVQLVSALERMQKSIVIMSADLRFVKGNAMTAVYFGENYLGRSIFEVITDNDDISKFHKAFQKLETDIHSKEGISIKYRSPCNGVNARWLESKIRRDDNITTGGHESYEYTIMTRNIDTQRKHEMLQKVMDDNKLQEIVTQSKLMYITSVAHDLKAPLQTFCFGLELIFSTALTATQHEILNQLKVASEMMKLSISQSIDIGKSLDNRIILPRKSTISLSETMDQVKVIMMGNSCSVPISFSISPCIEDNIITDREWLWQMLLNLLTNASKYTIEGSIAVTVDFVIDKQCLLFQVTDTGIGVSDDKKKTIFDAFNQAQIGQVTGTGLGLYGLRCRVEALGGICGVKDNEMSSTGTGSIFWFQIPYVTSERFNCRHSNSNSNDDDDDDDNMKLENRSRDCYDSLDDTIDNSSSTYIKSGKSVPTHRGSLMHTGKRSDSSIYCSGSPHTADLSHTSSYLHEELYLPNNNKEYIIPNTSNPMMTTVTSSTSFTYSQCSTSKYLKPSSSSEKTMISTFTSHSTKVGRRSLESTDLKDFSPLDTSTCMTSLEIFLIDDSLTILKMTSMTLRNLGFTNIECYENGYAGLQAMKKKYVDIVFTDVQMPVLTGPEMAQRFREFEKTVLGTDERFKRQIIIALTANTSEELSALVPSVFDHICTKPINSKDLMNMIQRFCNLRNIGDEMI